MASVKLTMVAHGVAAEKCNGCERQFGRGEQMSAVEYSDGEPAGWFCAGCLAEWSAKGAAPSPDGSGE